MITEKRVMQQMLEVLKKLPLDDKWWPEAHGYTYRELEDFEISIYVYYNFVSIYIHKKDDISGKNDLRLKVKNQHVLKKFSVEQRLYNYCQKIKKALIEREKAFRKSQQLEYEQKQKESDAQKYEKLSKVLETINDH